MRKLLILLTAVAFVVGFTAPAIAAEWGFYGSARMSTFMDSNSKEVTGTAYDDDDLTWDLQGNTRIGAVVKAGDIGGGFEYGHSSNTDTVSTKNQYVDKNDITLRKIYGTWTFGAGTLLVGQDYTPVNLFYSNQVWAGDTDMLPYGGIYNGRNPMLQLAMGGFKVALVKPVTGRVIDKSGTWGVAPPDAQTFDTELDTTLPKIEASYEIKVGPVALTLLGGYNTYDETVTATDKEESIDSYIVGLGFNVGLGAAYVKGNVYTGTNLGPYGLWQQGADDPYWDGTSVKDCDSTGYILVAGFKVSDTLSLEAGYGHVGHELDRTGYDKEDETAAYYVQATINLAKGCFIVPEIGRVDFKESNTGADQGDTTYYGAKWQINF